MPSPPHTRFSPLDFGSHIDRLTENFTGRQWMFDEVGAWLRREEGRFFILTGEPGIGKSAIAARLTQLNGQVAAHHFCIAGRNSTVNPSTFLRSVAAQLGASLPGYGVALANTIDPIHYSVRVEINVEEMAGGEITGVVIEHLYAGDVEEELDILLRAPLIKLPAPPAPVLIVVDSLDEAVTFRGAVNIVTLLAKTDDLPGWVRFVLTTRPEKRVLRYFHQLPVYSLAAESQMNLSDLRQYINNRVGAGELRARLRSSGVEPRALEERLNELSGGNFLYTKILLDDLAAGRQPLANLKALPRSLDEIYHGFLARFTVAEWEERFQPILGLLAVARESITEEQLARFTGIAQGKVRQYLGVAGQFLDVGGDGEGRETYALFHQSLRDYLLDGERSGDFWCNPEEHHRRLVENLRPGGAGWHELSDPSGYVFRNLVFHLTAAGLNEEAEALLRDFRWLRVRLGATDVVGLLTDLDGVAEKSEAVRLVRSALRLSLGVLARDKMALAGQLLGRLPRDRRELAGLLRGARLYRGSTWLRPVTASLMPSGGPLVYTLDGHGQLAYDFAVSSDGRFIVSGGGDALLEVWDVAGGRLVQTLAHHKMPVTCVALTGDDRYVVSASGDLHEGWEHDKTIRVWDLREGRETLCVDTRAENYPDELLLTPDGKLAVTTDWLKDHLMVWDLERGRLLHRLPGHRPGVKSLALTPDGSLLVTGGEDGFVRVWDLASGKEVRSMNHGRESLAEVRAAVTPDGARVVSASGDGLLRVWNLGTGAEEKTYAEAGGDVTLALTPDGRRTLAANDGYEVVVTDLDTGARVSTLAGHAGHVTTIRVTPDGMRVVTGSQDDTVRVWELETGHELAVLAGHTGLISHLRLIRNDLAVSASYDGKLKIWSLEGLTPGTRTSTQRNRVTAVGITSDGARAITASEQTLTAWALNSGREENRWLAHEEPITALATLGKQRAVTAAWGELAIWDTMHGLELKRISDIGSSVVALAATCDGEGDDGTPDVAPTVTPDGRYACFSVGTELDPELARQGVTAHLIPDKTLKVYDLDTGTQTRTIQWDSGEPDVEAAYSMFARARAEVRLLAALPSRPLVVGALPDDTIRIWNLQGGGEGRLELLAEGKEAVSAIAITPDEDTLLLGKSDGTVEVLELWSGESRASFALHAGRVVALSVGAGGRVVSAAGETLKFWSLESGTELASFVCESDLTSCVITPDGMTAVAGEVLGRVHVLDLVLGEAQAKQFFKELRSAEPHKRAAAVRALSGGSGSETLAALTGALKDEDAQVRRAAVLALGETDAEKSLPALAGVVADPNPAVRAAAAEVLGAAPSAEAGAALGRLLKDRDRGVRRTAAAACGRDEAEALGPEELAAWCFAAEEWERCVLLGQLSTPALEGGLCDVERDIRRMSAKTLSEIGWRPADEESRVAFLTASEAWVECVRDYGESAVPRLLDLLNTHDPATLRSAALALGATGDRRAVTELSRLLTDARPRLRVAAALALGAVGDPQSLPALSAALRDKDGEVAASASEALAAFGAEAVPFLVEALRDTGGDIRRLAGRALSEVGWEPPTDEERAYYYVAVEDWDGCVRLGAASLPALCAAMVDADGPLSAIPAVAMQSIGGPAIPWLAAELQRAPPSVREVAALALSGIKEPGAADALLSAYPDEDPILVSALTEALGRTGQPDAAHAITEVLRQSAMLPPPGTRFMSRLDLSSRHPLARAASATFHGSRHASAAQATRGATPETEPGRGGDTSNDLLSLVREKLNGRREDPARTKEEAEEESESGVVEALTSTLVSDWVERLHDGDIFDIAAQALTRLGGAVVEKELVELMAHKNAGVRRCAIVSGAAVFGASFAERLCRALRDETDEVRQAAAKSLKALNWQPAQVEDRVVLALELADWDALARTGEAGLQVLPRLWPLVPSWYSEEAVGAALQMNVSGSGEVFLPMLRDANPNVRADGASLLGGSGDLHVLDELIMALADEEVGEVRASIVRALGELGDERAVPALLVELRNTDPFYVGEVIDALGSIPDSGVAPRLVEYLGGDHHFKLREATERALTNLKDPAAAPGLISLLGGERDSTVIRLLALLGPPAVGLLACELKRDGGPASVGVARALESIGTPEALAAVLKWLGEGIEDEPHRDNLYHWRARMRMKLSDHAAALEDVEVAISLQPTYAEHFRLRGDIEKGRGDLDAAKEDYRKAIALMHPSSSDGHVGRGHLYMEVGEYASAVGDFTAAVEEWPGVGDFYRYRAIAYYHLGQIGAAVSDLEQAVELEPSDVENYLWLAHLYKIAGENSRAARAQQVAESLSAAKS